MKILQPVPFACFLFLTGSFCAVAQKMAPVKAPAAPLPAQLRTAASAFLSNLCSADQTTCTTVYNELYAGLQKQGKYTLVTGPATADLVFEIHYTTRLTNVTGSETSGPVSLDTTVLQLVVLDRATRTALWSFTESEARKQSAVTKVLIDLQQLVTSPGA